MSSYDTRHLTSTPGKTKGSWEMSHIDILLTAILALGAVVVDRLYGLLAAAGVGVLWFVVMFGMRYGHAYDDCLVKPLRNFWIRRVQKGYLWKKDAKRFSRKLRLRHVINSSAESIITDELTVGSIYDATKRTDTLVITGDGSDFVALNPDEQKRQLEKLEGIYKEVLAAQKGLGYRVKLTHLIRHRPDDQANVLAFAHEAFDPDVYHQKKKPKEEWTQDDHMDVAIRGTIQSLLTVTKESVPRVDMVITVTIPRQNVLLKTTGKTPSKRQVKKGEKLSSTRRRLDIIRLAKGLLVELEHWGVNKPVVLNKPRLHAFINQGWNLSKADQYYEWFTQSPSDEELPTGSVENGDDPQTMLWPQDHIKVTKYGIEMDDNYHAFIQWHAMPESCPPDFFPAILQLETDYGSTAHVTQAGRSNVRELLQNVTIRMGDTIEDAYQRVHYSTRSRMRKEARLSQEQLTAMSRAIQPGFIISGVCGSTPEKRDNDLDEAMEYLTKKGLRPVHVVGECNQLPALRCAIFGTPL